VIRIGLLAVLGAVFEPAERRCLILGIFDGERCAAVEEELDDIGVAFPTGPVKRSCAMLSAGIYRDAGGQESFDGGSAVTLGEIY